MAKYLLLSIASGVLLSISWPTYGVPFFIFFAMVPLPILQHDIQNFSKEKHKASKVFLWSWLSFLIWNAVATGWLYGSRNPDGSHSIPAVVLRVVLNSFFMALVFLAYHYYKTLKGTYWGLAFFVASWMVFEKIHLGWELSWPWLNLGNVFSEYPKLIQWYDSLGVTGGSFWILLSNVFAFYTLRIYEAGRKRKALFTNLGILGIWILLPMLISVFQYQNYHPQLIGKVKVSLLQPAVDPYNEKYLKDSITLSNELLDLAKTTENFQPDYIIAPETALPGNGSFSETGLDNSGIIASVRAQMAQRGTVWMSGISSHHFFPAASQNDLSAAARETSTPGIYVEHYNSAIQLLPNPNIQLYHKAKLVPAVEIFPYIHYLKPLLGNIMLDMGGSTASLGRSHERMVFTNPLNAGKAAPIICYESVYGEFVTGYVQKGANFLAIMTNDSWWGRSEGHRQLLSYARLRAIETRREIARAANSGISAHINSRGDLVADTIYGDRTVLNATVGLIEKQSFYTRAGDFISRICIIILGFLVFYPLFSFLRKKLIK